MTIAYPGESTEYRAARNQLLEQEKQLRRLTEEVAAARRALPAGGVVEQDYVFQRLGSDGTEADVRLSELFGPGKNDLLVYSFMYGPDRPEPCPSCSSMLDALDGVADHVRFRTNFVVVARSPIVRIVAVARQRGWHGLEFLSAGQNEYTKDYFGIAPDDETWEAPVMNAFRRGEDGVVRHFWGSELLFAEREEGQDFRHNDTIHPLWGLLDYTTEGRGGYWGPRLSYS